jgi:hypothetical protein
MAFPKNSKSALLALVTAGGLWAWQNRDKVASWAGQMSQRQPGHRKTLGDETYTSTATSLDPYTGSTRRINENESGL